MFKKKLGDHNSGCSGHVCVCVCVVCSLDFIFLVDLCFDFDSMILEKGIKI
jgi:hypothetical protein